MRHVKALKGHRHYFDFAAPHDDKNPAANLPTYFSTDPKRELGVMDMYKKLRIIVPALLLIVFGLLQFFALIPLIDNLIYDHLLVTERRPDPNIIIVGIDERSLDEIGIWPWPRYFMADAITKLTQMNAAAIGVSVLYDAYNMVEHDISLALSAGQTDRLTLAAMGIFGGGSQYEMEFEDYILPFYELSENTGTGFINVVLENDGVMRNALTSVKYGDITAHALPYEVYRTYCRVTGTPEMEIPLDSSGQFPINYAARHGRYPVFSLWGLINDEYSPELFEDSIVLIGQYAQGIGTDFFTTPLDRSTPAYGVEIYANIIQNMLEGRFIQAAPRGLNLVLIAILGIAIIVFLPRLKPTWAAVMTAVLIAAYIFGARLAFAQFDCVIRVGESILFLLIAYFANLVLSILAAQHEKQHIQGLFGRFVAPEVVKEIISSNIEVKLGGGEKELTVLFVDVRGFTAFSETNPPEKVVEMINRYLSLTSDAIQKHNGTIDKYIGDATMAVFNAPNDLEGHAMQAVKAAWDMKLGSVELREEILRDYGVDLQFGIGINTGVAVVGNMGSDFRMDYTVIGDTVNTAARLESNAAAGQILLSDATYRQIKDYVQVADLGVINVKNKKVGIQIYNLEGLMV